MRDSKQGVVVLAGSGWGTGVSSMNFGVQSGVICPSHCQGVCYSLISDLILCLELMAPPQYWTP